MGPSSRSKSQIEAKASPPNSMSGELNFAGRHANDRLIYILAASVGSIATVTLKSSERYEGVFAAASLDPASNCTVLKMTKRIHESTEQDETRTGGTYVGYGEDHVMVFDSKDIVRTDIQQPAPEKISHRQVNGASFRTDTDISGNRESKERQLTAWSDTSGSTVNTSLNGRIDPGYDQFAVHDRLTGKKSDYNEEFYNTAIDRAAPSYKERAARADRLAKEIESSSTDNPHVAEERNLISPEAECMDEESRYSGVSRTQAPWASLKGDKYHTPARRGPAGQADPAIIASSLARSESSQANRVKAEPPTQDLSKENKQPHIAINGGPHVPPESSAASTSQPGQTSPRRVTYEAAKEQIRALKPSDDSAPSIPPAAGPSNVDPPVPARVNGIEGLENKVHDQFKLWAASEKLKVADRHREAQAKRSNALRRDRELKINDLKKFSANFKLQSTPPKDILGILAKDKEKQQDIENKARQALETQVSNKASPEKQSPQAVSAKSTQASQAMPPTPLKTASRADRSSQGTNNLPTNRIIPGHLSQRLMANQQNMRLPQNMPNHIPSQDPRFHSSQPPAINTDVSMTRPPGSQTPVSAASRMRAQAHEFRPNPAASSFQMPGGQSSAAASPVRTRARSEAKPKQINRVKFFKGKKPEPGSQKPISDGFNSIARMKKEVAESDKKEKFVTNGGIPPPYTTAPVWPAPPENENRTYSELADKLFLRSASATPSPYPMAPVHQPAHHYNQGHYGPRTPSHQYRPHQARGGYFEDPRMVAGSPKSSLPASPSIRHPMMAQQQMPYRLDNNGQVVYPQPPTPGRGYPQGAFMLPANQMAPPMAMSNSNQGQYFGMPPQGQMPGYPHQVYQMPGPQAGYPSPRPNGAVMMPHGAAHMQGQQPHLYPMPQPGFGPGGPYMHMRGGVPMMHQGSQGLPHMMPQQHRGGGQYGGPFHQQQQMMQQGSPMPNGQMRQPPDQGEVR